MAKYAGRLRLDPGDARKELEAAILHAQRLAEIAVQRAWDQSHLLAEAIEASAPNPDADRRRAALRSAAIKDLQDHWWVQWRDGARWVDLDPSLPDAVPGRSITQVRLKAEPRDMDTPAGDSLWRASHHELTVRIVVEQLTKGELAEKEVVKLHLRPSRHIGETIELRHVPLNWPPEPLDMSATTDGKKRLRKTILQQHKWLPVLRVGERSAAQSTFDCSGNVYEPFHNGDRADATAEAPEPQTFSGELTAEWIECEIRAPGQRSRKFRRPIFDLLAQLPQFAEEIAILAVFSTAFSS